MNKVCCEIGLLLGMSYQVLYMVESHVLCMRVCIYVFVLYLEVVLRSIIL